MIFDHENNTENQDFSKLTDRPKTYFDETVLTEVFGSFFGPNFVLWNPCFNGGRWQKTSVSASGFNTSHLDPNHNHNLERAIALATDAGTGVGVSLGNDGLSVTGSKANTPLYLQCLDLDGFVDLTAGQVDDGVSALLDLLGTYCEISPSGTGLKCFYLSEVEPSSKKMIPFGRSEFADRYPGVKKYERREIEIFSKGFYLTLTGNLINEAEESSRLATLDAAQVRKVTDYLYKWAATHVPTAQAAINNEGAQQPPSNPKRYSKLTLTSLERVLAHIDPVPEEDWSNTANALARVYGEAARSLFHRYSSGELRAHQVDKYEFEVCEDRYTRALTELRSRPDGLGTKSLVEKASQSLSWNPQTILEYESDVQNLSTNPVRSSTPLNNHRGDIANGKRFANAFRDKYLHLGDLNVYLGFCERVGWAKTETQIICHATKNVVAGMQQEWAAKLHQDPDSSLVKSLSKEINRANSKAGLEAMIVLGRQEDGLWANSTDFDQDHYLVGLNNGVFDLKKQVLLAPSPEVKVSKRCPVAYDSEARCPNFEKYFTRVVPDDQVRRYLQKFMGYLLTGDTSEHIFLFLYGHGRNGKTVLVELLAWFLGDYAAKLQTEMLMQQSRSSQAASPDLAKLMGARYAYCSETAEGRQLNDSKIKELTGGDTIACRPLYGNEISFAPTHKLVMVGNYKPRIADNSEGMWRRMMLVPFEETISESEVDPKLQNKLRAEAAGIFNWAVEGFSLWQKEGLIAPAKLTNATNEYRNSEDTLNEWLHECCEISAGAKCKKTKLYDSYAEWCRKNGHQPLKSNEFGRKLSALGYILAPDNRHRIGLELTSVAMNSEQLVMDLCD